MYRIPIIVASSFNDGDQLRVCKRAVIILIIRTNNILYYIVRYNIVSGHTLQLSTANHTTLTAVRDVSGGRRRRRAAYRDI